MTRWSLLAVAFFGLGCSRTYIIQPASGGAVATASTTGVSMSAEPNAWNGNPTDLAEYLTPIWIGIVNQRRADVRVSYADFALTDESGFRYAAINPYNGQAAPPPPPAPAQPKSPPPAAPPPKEPAPPPAAAPPSSEDGRVREILLLPDEAAPTDLSERQPRADVVLARYGGHGGGYVHGGPQPGPGLYVHPYYHGYFHYSAPGPYSYYWPPYYGAYVYYWDAHYYPAAPSYDVLRLGLPQGFAKPGGSVSGFVYFQNAATRAGRLTLTWAVHLANGQRLATLSIPLVTVED
jgi:hypothetical protein